MTLHPEDSFMEWLALQRAALRSASREAVSALADWNTANAAIMARARRNRWSDYELTRQKANDTALNDAAALYGFKKGEVERISADIQAELAARQLLALAVGGDPTGLGYSRDDEVPAQPVPAHVEGHRLGGRTDRPHPPAGEADARLDAAAIRPAAVREAPTGAATPVGAGDNSPAGPSVNRRAAHQFPGRPGSQQGAAGVGASAAPTPSGRF